MKMNAKLGRIHARQMLQAMHHVKIPLAVLDAHAKMDTEEDREKIRNVQVS